MFYSHFRVPLQVCIIFVSITFSALRRCLYDRSFQYLPPICNSFSRNVHAPSIPFFSLLLSCSSPSTLICFNVSSISHLFRRLQNLPAGSSVHQNVLTRIGGWHRFVPRRVRALILPVVIVVAEDGIVWFLRRAQIQPQRRLRV